MTVKTISPNRKPTAAKTRRQTKPRASKRSRATSAASANGYVRAIKKALAEGAYLEARVLSAEGAARFPAHAQLDKYARVLAPPRVIGTTPAKRTDLRANRDWLKQNGDNYRGKWIALRDGQLRGVADSLDDLFAQTGTREVTVTKVF